VVLTEKLPPSNLTVLSLIGRQPYTNWIGKLTDTDIAKVNEAMELTQISHLSSENIMKSAMVNCKSLLLALANAQIITDNFLVTVWRP
jgi:iron complex transport system ATP-binding protein